MNSHYAKDWIHSGVPVVKDFDGSAWWIFVTTTPIIMQLLLNFTLDWWGKWRRTARHVIVVPYDSPVLDQWGSWKASSTTFNWVVTPPPPRGCTPPTNGYQMQHGCLPINMLVCTRAGSSVCSGRPVALATGSRQHYEEIGGSTPPMWPARSRDTLALTTLRRPGFALRAGIIPPPINCPNRAIWQWLISPRSGPNSMQEIPLTSISSLSLTSHQGIAKYGMVCDGYGIGGQPALVGCMLSTWKSGSLAW